MEAPDSPDTTGWTSIEITKLSKSFPGRGEVLKDLSFSIRRGDCVGLVGPNGSGKSTLLRAVLGLVTPTSGSIDLRFADRRTVPLGSSLRRAAILEGRMSAYERLSLRENCEYFCAARGVRFDEAYFQQLTRDFRVESTSKPLRKLSTGNKQRCSIIASLLHRPVLVILDEPTLGLDREGIEALCSAVRRLRAEYGTTFVVTSHDPTFIEATCESEIVIESGRLVREGPLQRSANVYTARVVHETGTQEWPCGSLSYQLRQLADLALREDIREVSVKRTEVLRDC